MGLLAWVCFCVRFRILIFEENFPCCVSCAFKLESDDTLLISRKSSLSKSLQRFAECQRFPPFFPRASSGAVGKKLQTTISEQKVPARRWTFRCVSNGTHLLRAVHLFLSRWKLTGSVLIIEAPLIIHSFTRLFICSPTCLFIHSFTLQIAGWFEWRFWFELLEFGAKMALLMLFTRFVWLYVFLTTPDEDVCFGGSPWGYRATSFLWSAYRHGNQAGALLMPAFIAWCHLCEQAFVCVVFPPPHTHNKSITHTYTEDGERHMLDAWKCVVVLF